jgi:hypothetical protein
MKVLKNATLQSKNDYTKIFHYNNIEVYLSKAIDEDTNRHFLIASIPNIEEVNCQSITYPLTYASEKERDEAFELFDEYMAVDLIEGIISFIKEQAEKNKKDEGIS